MSPLSHEATRRKRRLSGAFQNFIAAKPHFGHHLGHELAARAGTLAV